MTRAVVVGAGPNGLAAAVTLAVRGVEVTVLEAAETIGGGTRSGELTLPGLLHDHCSAVHPMGVGSPFFSGLGLERYGVTWRWPEVDLAHPLDGGEAGVLVRSVEQTARMLGEDGAAWRRLFWPLADGFDELAEDLMRPILHPPAHPLLLARFGSRALQSARMLVRRWETPRARALFAGAAAHGFHPLHRPATAAIGLMLLAVGHRHGWPVPEGGSRQVSDALARCLADHGGRVETGVEVREMAALPAADVVLLDLAPGAAAELLGHRMPGRIRRAYRRYRPGPGAFKLDLAVEGGIPWASPQARRAGTVHVGGTFEEVAHAERETNAGRMPQRPFVLVGQQYLADPTRSAGNVHPVWSYAHVPHGYPGDASEQVLSQLERFAPGVRERVVGSSARRADEWAAYNPNCVGGDIAGGANDAVQVVFRPRVSARPYDTGVPGVYLCSSSTPPGGGVHGMCGHNAALAALRGLG